MRDPGFCALQRGAAWLRRRLAAFTLIEMLVVIAIIGILAGILLPVLSMARERGRQAKCTSNLRQFSIAIEIYKNDNDSFFEPPFLSVLYPKYLAAQEIFVCPSDVTRGLNGSVPQWFAKPAYGASLFTETNDTDNCALPVTMPTGWGVTPTGWGASVWQVATQAWPSIVSQRNTAIHACSYIYEFSSAPCTWANNSAPKLYLSEDKPGHLWPDANNDKVLSWREIKATEQKGTYFDPVSKTVKADPKTTYNGWVPIMRCFWHANDNGRSLASQNAFNLASDNHNVYTSFIYGPGWQDAASK